LKQTAFFRLEAKEDLRNARDWYEAEREGLGFEFVDEVERAIERIETNPLSFAEVYRTARICPVKRFPYIIVFRTLDDLQEVLAVIHGHRDPEVWKIRSK
jgi:toxin ParE1/3/4